MNVMEPIDLKLVILQHPDCLNNDRKLKAVLLDLYPDCKRGMVNILVAIQQCGIVAEMQASKNPSALDMSRWKKVLDDNYAFDAATAETCLQMWSSAIEIQETNQEKNIASAVPELQNSQRDWFEYSGNTLLKLKEKYRAYEGAIYIPDGVEDIFDLAFSGCDNITSIAIPNSVTRIGRCVFSECSNLTSITMPHSMTHIGVRAFKECSSLKSITIPDGVMSIGEKTFELCRNLTSITIPNSVTDIGDEAFKSCSRLAGITLPSGVTNIGAMAFEHCKKLMNITIPNSVTDIGWGAFWNCESLKEILYTGEMRQWKAIRKDVNWNGYSGSYIVHCTDGDMSKNESVQNEDTILPEVPNNSQSKQQSIGVGDTYIFGTYEQDNDISNGKEAIKWIVLAKEGNRILLLSEKGLDCKPYNNTFTNVTWETCSLRKWMNSTFLNAAFSAKEQKCIVNTSVSADKNPDYSTDPGNATMDKVFLLSITEANKYFGNNEVGKCVPTIYAIANGAKTSNSFTMGDAVTSWWWLRSPGYKQTFAASGIDSGEVFSHGLPVPCRGCVRPALWINLDS